MSRRMMMAASNEFVLNIATNVAAPNIWALAIAQGWDKTKKLRVNITAPLVNVLNIHNNAYPGGLHIDISAATRIGSSSQLSPISALYTFVNCTINNLGIISGAGGCGGSGATCWVRYSSGGEVFGIGGSGGMGHGFESVSSLNIINAQPGSSGTYGQYNGSIIGGHTRPWANGGSGGSGGNTWGAQGGYGLYGSYGGNYSSYDPGNPFPGSTSISVEGNNKITWINTGTRLGSILP
ncbi:hypothetical protein G7045_10425 [Acidovorax sp. HDW3]|uniref:hypothetical protein n=1 Tax=Acidovorax sp. HDW3 TaxID=2714923 RepID=UPI001408C55A|nr:hypothetical protein [Acidovorax sp. HDW3]QIL44645.1 hypothetical protein G7045_10425 [Acidovorax sp. HDW3]